ARYKEIMKFISIVALLAPAALAAKQAPGDAWITLLKEQCHYMPEPCIDIAKKPLENVSKISQAALMLFLLFLGQAPPKESSLHASSELRLIMLVPIRKWSFTKPRN
ncbi:hypothetical protein O988_02408, partial [Pseudogymnoascus sp. VKM F-3808]